ncbi:YjzC family protein [Halobacillus sp. MO56]
MVIGKDKNNQQHISMEVSGLAEEERFQTGDKAAETGQYRFDSLVEGFSQEQENKVIRVAQDEEFPAAPESGKPAYWVKIK